VKVALIGSVTSSWHTLAAFIDNGVEVSAVLGVDPKYAKNISGYRDLSILAREAKIPYLYFRRVRDTEVETFLRAHPFDLLWLIGLSQLVPKELIALAQHHAIGFNPTLLAEGRGRAPIAWTVLLGARAAVNLFYLSDEADAGEIIVQREVPVSPDDYSEDLIERLELALVDVIANLAPLIRSGRLPPAQPQDHSKATYHEKRTPPADGLIHWTAATKDIYSLVRAAGRPYPGAFSFYNGKKVIIWRAKPEYAHDTASETRHGKVLAVKDGQLLIATGTGAIWATEIDWREQQSEPIEIDGYFSNGENQE
jgi:methionyl-tRNA formyltransferase